MTVVRVLKRSPVAHLFEFDQSKCIDRLRRCRSSVCTTAFWFKLYYILFGSPYFWDTLFWWEDGSSLKKLSFCQFFFVPSWNEILLAETDKEVCLQRETKRKSYRDHLESFLPEQAKAWYNGRKRGKISLSANWNSRCYCFDKPHLIVLHVSLFLLALFLNYHMGSLNCHEHTRQTVILLVFFIWVFFLLFGHDTTWH